MEIGLLINSVCFVFSLGLTCLKQLQPPVVICVSAFVHMCLWATLLENEAGDHSQTQQEDKGMAALGSNLTLCPKEPKGREADCLPRANLFFFFLFFVLKEFSKSG